MEVITEEDIRESNRLKKEACNNIKDALKDVLPADKLKRFEEDFYSAAKGYLLKKKEL